MENLKRRVITLVMGIVMLTPMVAVAGGDNVQRLSGSNRILTSEEVSKNAYNDSKEVVVTGFKGTADALTGTLLASEKGAPLLIIDSYDKGFKEELSRLGASKVTLLGGYSVISKGVEEAIRKDGYQVVRVAGRDRVATAVDVMGSSRDKGDHVFLTNDGRSGSLADALAIGSVSGRDRKPILLTSTTKLPKETLEALNKYGVKKVTVVGGPTAVGEGVVKDLRNKGFVVERVSGTNRYETALKVSDKYFKNSESAIVTNDGNVSFADALLAGYLGAKEGSPILLTSNKSLSKSLETHIKETKKSAKIIGGNSVVSKSIESRLKELLNEAKGEEENTEGLMVITSKESLIKEIEKRVNNREKGLTVDYRGEKLLNSKGVDNMMEEIKSASSYNIGTLNQTVSTVEGKYGKGNEKIKLQFFYNTTEQEEEYITKEVERIKGEVLVKGMTGYEIVEALHGYVVENMEYTTETVNSRFSPYTAFKEGKGVCNAYVLMLTRLLDSVGVENYYVIGHTTDGKYHAWNKVKMDNSWYNIDPTWATKEEDLGKHGQYYYFMNSDERFYKTRIPRSTKKLPVGNSKKYDGMYDDDFTGKK